MLAPLIDAADAALTRVLPHSDAAAQSAGLRERAHRPWPLPDGPWLQGQTWRDLLFAHWPVPVEALRPAVPRAPAGGPARAAGRHLRRPRVARHHALRGQRLARARRAADPAAVALRRDQR